MFWARIRSDRVYSLAAFLRTGMLFAALNCGFIFHAGAHICGPTVQIAFPGQLFNYTITSDVLEVQDSYYQLISVSDPTVVSVGPAGGFFARYYGKFNLYALKPGAADVTFYWSYAPYMASGYCTVHIIVTSSILGTAGNFPMSAFTMDPVNAYTGELTQNEPADLDLGGPMPLEFRRYYASDLTSNLLVRSTLGINWSHNFDFRLATFSNRIDVVTSQGRRTQFQKNGGVWQSLSGSSSGGSYQLLENDTVNSTNYVLGDRRQNRIYTFDDFGELISIADGKGNVHTLTYTNNVLYQVSDGLGRVLSFTNGGFQLLGSVGDGTRAVQFFYSADETYPQLLGVIDPLFRFTTYAYDTNNPAAALLTARTFPAGNTAFTQKYDSSGRVILQVENGVTTNYFAYGTGSTIVTNPLGFTHGFAHTTNGQLTAYTDETGSTVAIQMSTNHQRSAITDRLGRTTGFGYDPVSGKIAALTNSDGTVTTFAYTNYTASGITFYEVSRINYPDGANEQFTYDGVGNLISEMDRLGRVRRFTYNNHGQPLTEINPLGGVVTYTYNPDGTVASRTDSDVGITTYVYDALKRRVATIHPDGTTNQVMYDADSEVVATVNERGGTNQLIRDGNGRVTSVIDPAGGMSQTSFDTANRVVSRTDRLGHISGRVFGMDGHVSAVTNRNGEVITFKYNSRGGIDSVMDPGGKSWNFGYNAEEAETFFADPLAHTNFNQLDPLGYLIGRTNPLNSSFHLTRDSMRRTTQFTDEIGRMDTFLYDAGGLVASHTRPTIGSSTFMRDDLDQIEQFTDLNGRAWSAGYSKMGRPQSITDPLGRSTSFGFNPRGEVAKTSFADGVTRTNIYDAAGFLIHVQCSDGTDLPYGLDALSRLTNGSGFALARDAEGRVTNTIISGFAAGAAYDAGGRVTNLTFNGFTITYRYDNRDRLTNVSDSLTGTQISLLYDDAGRLTNVVRPNAVNGVYTYNAAGGLTRIREGSIIDLQYSLDGAGQPVQANIIAPLDPAGLTPISSSNWTFDAASQISNPGYSFDARGRQTAAPGHTFAWDAVSRLKSVDTTTFTYNGVGDLLARNSGGNITQYFYNYALGGGTIIAERNGNSGLFVNYYVWAPGIGLLYAINAQNNAVSFYHFDRTGSTLALTAGNGSVSDAYAYSPYGQMLGHTGASTQPFTFVGQLGVRSEATAGLYHMRARYYDPVTTRFLSPDPAWPRLSDPQSLNPYVYSRNSPIQYIDPGGLVPLTHTTTISGYVDTSAQFDQSSGYAPASTRGDDRLAAFAYEQNSNPLNIGFLPNVPGAEDGITRWFNYSGGANPNMDAVERALTRLLGSGGGGGGGGGGDDCCCCDCCCDCCCCDCCCDCCDGPVRSLTSFTVRAITLLDRRTVEEYRPQNYLNIVPGYIKFTPIQFVPLVPMIPAPEPVRTPSVSVGGSDFGGFRGGLGFGSGSLRYNF